MKIFDPCAESTDVAADERRPSRILPAARDRAPRTPVRSVRLIVVEDEALVAQTIKDIVEDLGHAVCGIADTEASAVELARVERPDLALMDIRLGDGGDGIAAARGLAADFGIRSIFLSGYADHATMSRITETYPLGVVHKPFSAAQLKSALDLAVRRLRPVPA
ncbi:response regulator [Azospirillum sp. A39]|uniref:response regulator n=1 Tax=Azospirillum sp. A39 TaxID=3462279 RepID=UPI004045A8AA